MRPAPQKMAAVHAPADQGPTAVRALLRATAALAMSGPYDGSSGPLHLRCPPEHGTLYTWAVPVDPRVTSMPQPDPSIHIALEVWVYDLVAEIEHSGPFMAEASTCHRLLDFIEESGYTLTGPHERITLTRPGTYPPRVLIRYPIKPARVRAPTRILIDSA